jgi:pimeloyl-ACP methyl ester carboxylesterase
LLTDWQSVRTTRTRTEKEVIRLSRLIVNGVELYVEQSGSGAALIYVHGGFASLGRKLQAEDRPLPEWQSDFAAAFWLISYDRRGCGRSARPPDGYDLSTQADDLAALIDKLALDAAHLFASSAGGPIAMLYAARHPDRVHSLTIQGSSLSILRPGDGVREPALAAHQLLRDRGEEAAFHGRPAGIEVWFETPWGRRQAAADGRLRQYLAEEAKLTVRARALPLDVRTSWYAAELRNIHGYHDVDLRPYTAVLTIPTLVLHGEDDQIFSAAAGRELAAAVPGARFELIDAAGHGPVFTSATARELAVDFMNTSQRAARAYPLPSYQLREKQS